MFLHSGASLHGHEYSTRSSLQQPPRRLPFLRSALRQPADSETRTAAVVAPPSSPPAPSPRPVSYHEHAPIAPRTSRPRPTSDYMPRRELSVRFREPETDDDLPPSESPQSEDEGSAACSDLSDLSDCSTTTRKRRRRKRTPRKSTQFILAHPAPRLRPKQRKLSQVRPRLLLQLQDLTDKRPTPAFDVLPASLVVGSLIVPRLAKRCPRLFCSKPVLGLNDLLIVRSEDYDTPASPGSLDAEDCLDQRDLIAVVGPLPHMGDDAAEIVMEDGSTWEASLMANGSYEFIGVDERGRISTARWVKKAAPTGFPFQAAATSNATPPSSPAPPEFKWTFSMIHPDTRRHPIMGSLMSNALDVFDTYNTMSTSSGRYPPTRPAPIDPTGAPDWTATSAVSAEGRLTKAVPEDIKLLMVVTAAWINLRQEGWPETACTRPPPATLQRRTSNAYPPRSQSFPVRNNFSSPPPVQNPPQLTGSPMSSIRDLPIQDPGRRRSMSGSAGFVRRFVAPRASEEGRPPLENIYFEAEKADKVERPQSRRMSIRQITNRIFRRKSVSQAQSDEPFYKLEY
ncbi:hypothetical protein EDB81DRAFT_349056 [Dactylonectria macrodidyma]|uniref:Uncharacterized protein n=1 Tax=Dactylonectria macrodidyma TaxID=307937 RepID=A0A9P9JHD8_9HYPO|nr:hypothetical protein EDB81DRAFT_349056 [Dactylonectria macrodidyma]